MFFTQKITKSNFYVVRHLIRPFFQAKLLEGLNKSICFALYCVDTPVGVVYGEVDQASDKFVIQLLSVADNFKDRKLEEILLNDIEAALIERNEKEVLFSFRIRETEKADYVMNILMENGWQEPYLSGYLFGIDKEVLNWKGLTLPLAKGMKTCKWNQLPGELIDKLVIEQKANRSFPDFILWYLNNNKYSHERSAALVLGSKIIGWMFVEISETDHYIYSYAHVLEEYQRVGKSVPFISLFKETVSGKGLLDDFKLIFSVNADNEKMFYITCKQWRPYMYSLYREYHSEKKL